ncbi:hypothetical protein CHS0354_031240 [Potamilus streckersoni]|uniref:Uncharacterized protein n=1 Tax=Potamilus streckersoni TaxID=2493646 RepID=A0AAE0SBP5_9BIVA|nr:hypothetical protein CHS0354_031240 [Potamilus streckersoni]
MNTVVVEQSRFLQSKYYAGIICLRRVRHCPQQAVISYDIVLKEVAIMYHIVIKQVAIRYDIVLKQAAIRYHIVSKQVAIRYDIVRKQEPFLSYIKFCTMSDGRNGTGGLTMSLEYFEHIRTAFQKRSDVYKNYMIELKSIALLNQRIPISNN